MQLARDLELPLALVLGLCLLLLLLLLLLQLLLLQPLVRRLPRQTRARPQLKLLLQPHRTAIRYWPRCSGSSRFRLCYICPNMRVDS